MRRNEDLMPMRRERGSDLSPWYEGGGFGSSFFGSSPWQMMRRMQEDMDRVFSQLFGGSGGFGATAPAGQQTNLQQWAPSVDISQNDKEWCVEVDLPGVKKEDIHAEVRDHHLFLRAEMRQEEQSPGSQAQGGQPQGNQPQGSQAQGSQPQQRQYFHRERRYGYLQRVLPLPENIDEENVSCDFRDGVLTIHLPKTQQALQQGRRIPVGTGETQPRYGKTQRPPEYTGTAPERGRREEREPAMAGSRGGEASSPPENPQNQQNPQNKQGKA